MEGVTHAEQKATRARLKSGSGQLAYAVWNDHLPGRRDCLRSERSRLAHGGDDARATRYAVTVQVSVPERPTLLRVQRATVLWVKDHEFAIEPHDMEPMDLAWVSEFLHHKLGLTWILRTTHPENSPPPASPKHQRALPVRSLPSLEDVLQHLLGFRPID